MTHCDTLLTLFTVWEYKREDFDQISPVLFGTPSKYHTLMESPKRPKLSQKASDESTNSGRNLLQITQAPTPERVPCRFAPHCQRTFRSTGDEGMHARSCSKKFGPSAPGGAQTLLTGFKADALNHANPNLRICCLVDGNSISVS